MSQVGEAGGNDEDSLYWKRNLAVCVFGSFSAITSLTLVIPFLPIYVEQLGIHDQASIAEWSGSCFAVAFLAAGLVAPLWGNLANRYGRKLMLIRASLGMVICMPLMGLVGNVWQLFALRLCMGLLGGYASGAMILIATQAPKMRAAWALGILSSGVMAGNLVGPLVGGVLPQRVGVQETFYIAGGVLLLSFLTTLILVREDPRRPSSHAPTAIEPAPANHGRVVVLLLALGLLTVFGNMSIEPIITIYVGEIISDKTLVTTVAGLAMSATALGSIVSASSIGKLADRTDRWIVIAGGMGLAALMLLPQAVVTQSWQLIGLRFAMGLALGGLLPCITSQLRNMVEDEYLGVTLGYLVSSQFAGQVVGPLLGGIVGGRLGLQAVFLMTALFLTIGALGAFAMSPLIFVRRRNAQNLATTGNAQEDPLSARRP